MTNVRDTYYIIGIGRRAASVPDDGARLPVGDRQRGAAADPAARRAAARLPGRLRRRRQQRDRALPRRSSATARVQLIGVEAAGHGHRDRARTPRRSRPGRSACCTATRRTSCRTRPGRSATRTRSPPGSTIPASARSTPICATAGARTYVDRRPTPRRSRRCSMLDRDRGHHPGARERARDRARDRGSRRRSRARPDRGRQPLRARRQGHEHRRRATSGVAAARMSRIAATFARAARRGTRRRSSRSSRPAIPTSTPRRALVRAAADAGADLIELGVPFSDPMADGPVLQRSARARARGGHVAAARPRAGRASCARELDDADRALRLLQPVLPLRRRARSRATPRAAGVDGLLCVDLPPEEADELRAAARAAGLDLIFLLAPTTPPARVRRDRARARAASSTSSR